MGYSVDQIGQQGDVSKQLVIKSCDMNEEMIADATTVALTVS